MIWIKVPVLLAAAAYILPQLPEPASWQPYAGFAVVLGIMLTLLEIAKRLMDMRKPPPTMNGVSTTLKQISDTMGRLEGALNASTTALALISERQKVQAGDHDAVQICLTEIRTTIVAMKQTVDTWAA